MFDRQGNRKYLNAIERKAFLRASLSERDFRKRAFCLTLYHAGCRISEALNLTIGRIDVHAKAITFETLKRRQSGHYRSVPVPDDLLGLLRKCVAGKNPASRIWSFSRSTGYRLVKSHMMRARIVGGMGSPKGLRHGFGVACIEHNIPLTTARKWLGHARLETTAIYLDVAGKEERSLAKRLWAKPSKKLGKSRRKRSV